MVETKMKQRVTEMTIQSILQSGIHCKRRVLKQAILIPCTPAFHLWVHTSPHQLGGFPASVLSNFRHSQQPGKSREVILPIQPQPPRDLSHSTGWLQLTLLCSVSQESHRPLPFGHRQVWLKVAQKNRRSPGVRSGPRSTGWGFLPAAAKKRPGVPGSSQQGVLPTGE